jgi:hypothetical protein
MVKVELLTGLKPDWNTQPTVGELVTASTVAGTQAPFLVQHPPVFTLARGTHCTSALLRYTAISSLKSRLALHRPGA